MYIYIYIYTYICIYIYIYTYIYIYIYIYILHIHTLKSRNKQTMARNMLVKKNVLNEINEEGTFQGLQENQKEIISKFR